MSEQQLGDAPIEERFREQMTGVVRALDEVFNGVTKGSAREVGFVLLVFPYGSHDGRCNFISNGADRQDIVALFKEMLARFEGQPEMSGNA